MRQAMRDKVLYVFAGFGVLLIAGSVIVSQLTVGERARIVMNLGLSATCVLGTLTAVFVTINQVAREIDRKAIASILTKPVARWELLVGRFVGMAATLAVLESAMAGLHVVILGTIDGYDASLWKAAWLGYVETVLVVAIALFLSSFITTLPSIFLSLAFVLIGHTSWGLAMLAERATAPAARWALGALYTLLPNLELMNVRAEVVWDVAIPWTLVAHGTLYATGYSAVLLVLASWLFARRDLA